MLSRNSQPRWGTQRAEGGTGRFGTGARRVRTGTRAGPERQKLGEKDQRVTRALLQVRPPPKATSRRVSPGWQRPVSRASSKAIGTLAADVLPYLSRLTMTLEGGICVASRAASMMR